MARHAASCSHGKGCDPPCLTPVLADGAEGGRAMGLRVLLRSPPLPSLVAASDLPGLSVLLLAPCGRAGW